MAGGALFIFREADTPNVLCIFIHNLFNIILEIIQKIGFHNLSFYDIIITLIFYMNYIYCNFPSEYVL